MNQADCTLLTGSSRSITGNSAVSHATRALIVLGGAGRGGSGGEGHCGRRKEKVEKIEEEEKEGRRRSSGKRGT